MAPVPIFVGAQGNVPTVFLLHVSISTWAMTTNKDAFCIAIVHTHIDTGSHICRGLRKNTRRESPFSHLAGVLEKFPTYVPTPVHQDTPNVPCIRA